VQTNFEQDSTYHIDILSPFSDQVSGIRLTVFELDNSSLTYLKKYNLELQVQNTYSGKKLKQFINPVTDSSTYFGLPDRGPDKEAGILSFVTYKGDLGGFEIDPRAVVLDYEGMQFQREFYAPVYDTPEQQHSPVPDYRSLLYWSPSIRSGLQGKSQVTFYTSDRAGNYIGVIHGLTAEGKAASQFFTFQVK